MIRTENLTHTYMPGTPFEYTAIRDVNIEINEGEFVAVVGHTGSGKSTLIQHLNALLRPTSGKVYVEGIDTAEKGAQIRSIRQRVGLVFQYPEHQLFEETVEADVAYGPRNLGLSEEEVAERVREAIGLVGLDYEAVCGRSPFDLSGGQMRRVALAGVLAMRPKVLILDEPTAGLDPRGRDEILAEVKNLHRRGFTIILVTHSMEDVARLAERLIVMYRGRVVRDGPTREIFKEPDFMKSIGLGVPEVTELAQRLRARGIPIAAEIITPEQAVSELARLLRTGGAPLGGGQVGV